jgi:restriction system protein
VLNFETPFLGLRDGVSILRRVVMSIPDYQTLMLPLLEFAGNGQEHSSREAINHLAVALNG